MNIDTKSANDIIFGGGDGNGFGAPSGINIPINLNGSGTGGLDLLGLILPGAAALGNFITDQVRYDQARNDVKQENEKMREREDNAIQRQMADLRRAGINPLMAGQLGGANANLGNFAQYAGQNYSGYTAAMQDQLATIMSLKHQKDMLEEQKRHNVRTEDQTDKNIENDLTKIQNDWNFKEIQIDEIHNNIALLNNEDKRKAEIHTKNISKISAEISQIYSEIDLNFVKEALMNAQTTAEYKRVEEMSANIVLMGKQGKKILSDVAMNCSNMNVNAARIDEIKQHIASMQNHDDYENFMKWIHGISLGKDVIQMLSSEARNWVNTISNRNPVKQIKEMFTENHDAKGNLKGTTHTTTTDTYIK